jgi:hypothetical protein
MATQYLPNNPRSELENLLHTWESRWRLRRLVLYLPRVLLIAFGLGILAALILGVMRLVPVATLLMIVAAICSATIVILSSVFGLFSKQGMERVRKFDRLFDLQERLSTSFELLDGRIKTVEELADLQIRDTLHHAQDIDPKKMLRLEWRAWEWLGAVLLAGLLVLVLGLMVFFSSLSGGMGANTQMAIEAAAETTGEIIDSVATDNTLSDDERQSLIESAETALAELQNPSSAEDSFAAMSELSADLTAQAQEIREDVAESELGLNTAAASLGSTDPNAANLGEQLGQAGQSLSNMSQTEQEELAENLEEAADSVREENPELAQSMDEAAQAIQNGDMAGAEQALNTAGQQADSSTQSNSQAAASAEQMEQLASEAEQAARDIATSEYNENAQTEGNIDTNSTIEEALGMEPPDLAGAEGEDGGGGNGDTPSEGTEGDLVESDDPDARSANTEGQSEGQNQEGTGQGQQSEVGSGAGDGESSQSNEVQGGAPQAGTNMDNDADGEGEEAYEEIYAPMQESPNQGQDNVTLDTSEGGQAAAEGDFQDNPGGTSSVPYNQVFADYSAEANAALESGYVPLGVRDVVRDYFTSIEPTSNTQSQP